MTRRVAVVTGSRADYGLLHPLLAGLAADDRFELQLIVTGAHLSAAHGMTVAEIEADELPIAERVPLPLADSRLGVTNALAEAVRGIGESLDRVAPDVLVLLGDRYETFGAAAAATVLRIPIAHIHGGELTLGAIDDAFRHAITKMAWLHFTSAEEYRRRVIQMGEEPSRVFNVGALAVGNVKNSPRLTADEFSDRFGVACDADTLLATFHPVSVRTDSLSQLAALLEALDGLPQLRVLFTGSNADAEGQAINDAIASYVSAHPERAALVSSLGREGYLAAARLAGAVVGNSSSGVIEIPALGVPSADIGDRQAGRIRPTSVVHVEPDADAIRRGIEKALSAEFRSLAAKAPNPYGDGTAAEQMLSILGEADFSQAAHGKRFYDLDEDAS